MDFFSVILLPALIAIDQLTKLAAMQYGPIKITSYMQIAQEANYGFAFSLFAGFKRFGQLPFIIAAAMVIPVVFFVFKNVENTVKARVAKSLILAGSLSNIADRAFRGFVVDFVSIQTFGLKWSVFNIADVFVLAGLLYLNYKELQ